MKTRNEAIRKHLSDMLAVESHIKEAVERQLEEDEVLKHSEATALLQKISLTVSTHCEKLEAVSEAYGGDLQAQIKQTITELVGAVAGLYNKVRQHELSRMLRDNYTALSLSAMSYTSMHAFGLAIREPQIAALAQQHLHDLTPLMVELSKVLPDVVVLEVAEESDFEVDVTVGQQAVDNTQEAWAPPVV